MVPSPQPKVVSTPNKFLQRQYLNKQKSPEAGKVEIDQDMDDYEYQLAIKNIFEQIVALEI